MTSTREGVACFTGVYRKSSVGGSRRAGVENRLAWGEVGVHRLGPPRTLQTQRRSKMAEADHRTPWTLRILGTAPLLHRSPLQCSQSHHPRSKSPSGVVRPEGGRSTTPWCCRPRGPLGARSHCRSTRPLPPTRSYISAGRTPQTIPWEEQNLCQVKGY